MDKCIINPKSGENIYVKDCEAYGYVNSSTPVCTGCKSGKATSEDHKSCIKSKLKVEKC